MRLKGAFNIYNVILNSYERTACTLSAASWNSVALRKSKQINGEIIIDGVNESILIIVLDPFEINQNDDLTDLSNHKSNFLVSSDQNICSYDFEDTISGFINFSKIDQNNFIVSGTFEFSTVTDNCETINITSGRFDLQYIP